MDPRTELMQAVTAGTRGGDGVHGLLHILETLPLVVYIDAADEHATSLWISPQVESMLGYPAAAWMDPGFFEAVVHADDLPQVAELLKTAFREGRDGWNLEYRMIASDGRTVWVRDDATVVKDAAGAPAYVQGFMIDITGQKAAAADVRRQKLYFESLVEINPTPVVTMDTAEIVTGWNPAAARLFGYPAEEAVGRSIDDLILTSAELRADGALTTRAALESGEVRRVTRRARRDGTLIDVEMVMVPLVVDEEPSGFYAIYRDITDRVRGDALRRLAEAATGVLDMRGFYAAVHEIVSELIGVRSFYIAVHDAERDLLSFPYYVDEIDLDVPDPDAWESMAEGRGTGLTAYVLRTGQPILVNPEVYASLLESGEVAEVGADSLDWIGVPLRSAGRTIGVMAVQTYSEAVRFGAEQRDLLADVGPHVATALQRARLAVETRQHLRELETVNRIGQALASQLDLDALIALVGTLIGETFSSDVTYVALLDADEATIDFPFYAERGVPSERPSVPLGDGPTSRVLRSHEPLLLHGRADFGAVGERLVGAAEGSYLGVPIVSGDEAIGVLGVQTTGSDARYDDADARLLETVAANVGVAIQNARLLSEHRAAEARYRSLVESIPVAMYRSAVQDQNASEYMSERAVTMFGYPAEAWEDPAFFATVLHPDDREWVLAENDLAPTEGDTIWVSEYRVIAADGRTVWVRDESWTVRDEQDIPQYLQGCMIDVTEKKEAEIELAAALESLRKAEEEYRRLIEELPMAVYTDKPDTTATSTYISPRVELMFGYPREAWMDEAFFASVVHPEDYDHVIGSAAKSLGGTDERTTNEYRIIAADGGVVWVRDDQWIVRDEQGTPLHIQGFMIDITEQHEAALEIRRQKQYFESLVEVSPVAVVVTDREERIAAWNPTATRLFGYEAEEAIGRSIGDLLPESDPVAAPGSASPAHDDAGRSGRISQRACKNGSRVEVEVLRVPLIIDGEPSGHYVIYHDISDLQRARREAETATQAKSAFLATMSHEIRTPMNAIIGMSGLLLDTELTGEQQEFAETIQTSGDALLTIINDILDFSKIEAGHVDLEAEPFALAACVEAALDLLAPTASSKGIELAYSLALDLPRTIVGDAGRLRQIVLNLLSNAVKFTTVGEVVLTMSGRRIDTGDPAALGRWEIGIEVRDTGAGIPPDRLGHLFQSFSQADASISRRFGGTGLGLAISRRLAEAMGGSITADSTGQPGEGSVFRFSLEADAAPDPDPVATLAARVVDLEGKRVLIVDDNDTNRRILRAQTEAWGMEPYETESPHAALELLRAEGSSYDLLLLDYLMPEMDGLELVRAIGQLGLDRHIPVVMLTSVVLMSRELTSVAASLTKPAKPSALHEVIVSIFAGRPAVVRSKGTRAAMDGEMAIRLPLKILVAEDNVVNQKLVLRLLERLGYSADLVENGIEAVAAVERHGYDFVLMDLQMPELDGLEATRRILARHPADSAPRIAALTANAMAEDRAMCMAAGMHDYLSKPIRPEELVAALERAAAARAAG
jgi:PAS domain S-box-containing protein